MVSCTQIENSLQAYIDGEVGASERAIFEQHVDECPICKDSLRAQQRANAMLFSAYSGERLTHSLRYRIVAHLPEIESVRIHDSVVDLINERAKHPISLWGRVGRLMPVAAIAILLFVTLVLRYSLPETPEPLVAMSIGVVTAASGVTVHAPKDAPSGEPAGLSEFVLRGDQLETRSGSGIMLSLTGPTSLKIGENSRVRVEDARSVMLDYGRIWLDVGRDGRLFKIHTPRGQVTVFGTVFSVSHINNETQVTVERGEVQVTEGDEFRQVEGGQQVVAKSAGELTEPALVNSRQEHSWARRIMPDSEAEKLFSRRLQSRSPSGELPSRQVYMVSPYTQEVTAIRLYWQPDQFLTGHCSYDLYVSGDNDLPIFHRRIEGSQFSNPGVSSLEIVPDKPIVGMETLEIRLVPDYKSGRIEIDDVQVKALVVEGS
ncbi:MAG: FecR domain-containing protein [Candidatus Hydrogenedentes bacterium]|nr:FecR domain-containing protein [Candidatus Hydrogenedentota bacterium]